MGGRATHATPAQRFRQANLEPMPTSKKTVAKEGTKASRVALSRKPGRPVGAAAGVLDRDTIIAVAFRLTKTISVSELSIVRVAKELGVTPALIHYYLAGGGRDALTSGVMNSFYREVIEQWPVQTGDWQQDFEVVADSIYRAHLRYPGISVYVASHNRYQMVQDVAETETDYGLLMLERFSAMVRQIGFDGQRTGVTAHLLMMFISSFAHSTVARRWPGQHADFLRSKLSELDPDAYPNCYFVKDGLINLNAAEAFSAGLRLVLLGLNAERKGLGFEGSAL